MRDDSIRWLTPVGPRHDFAPPPEHGRLRRAGVATRRERRTAARAVLRSVGKLSAALVVATLVTDAVGGGLAADPVVVWLVSVVATAAVPPRAIRLARVRLGRD